jgi:uncharacterized membrane protein YfcA
MVILMGAVGRYIYCLKIMNPDKPTTVAIDYSIATIMIATSLAGSQIGSELFLRVFPPLIIQICLEALLVFLAINSFFKAREISKAEEQKRLTQNPELKLNETLQVSDNLDSSAHS